MNGECPGLIFLNCRIAEWNFPGFHPFPRNGLKFRLRHSKYWDPEIVGLVEVNSIITIDRMRTQLNEAALCYRPSSQGRTLVISISWENKTS